MWLINHLETSTDPQNEHKKPVHKAAKKSFKSDTNNKNYKILSNKLIKHVWMLIHHAITDVLKIIQFHLVEILRTIHLISFLA